MKVLITAAAILIALGVIGLIVLEVKTIQANRDARAHEFATGHVPAILPDGSYRGAVSSYTGNWVGKSFDLGTHTGINDFKGGKQAYTFSFYEGSSLGDENLSVIKIDYDNKQNPFWLRSLVDEIVETDTANHFLGTIHLRLIGMRFTLGYFALER